MSDTSMTLAELGLTAQGGADARVTGIEIDSRKVREGTLFAALPGTRTHGAAFIEGALKDGAAAILTDREGAAMAAGALGASHAALVVAEDARATLAHAAALWFGPVPEIVVAVTGTNGKTSVASFTRQIWEALDRPAVNVGTTGVEGHVSAPGNLTTPDALALQSRLADLARAGVEAVAMEASSHGLDQRRLDAVPLVAAGFTNLTQDHLDYHGTMEAYFEAKLRLFTELLPDEGVAVVNVDDPYGARVVEAVTARETVELIRVGQYAEEAELKIAGRRLDETGQELLVNVWGKPRRVRLPLIGAFQAMNVLVAAGLAVASSEDVEDVLEVLPRLAGVRGRMQLAGRRANGAPIYVDYAHTPDALETALKALRPHVLGRLHVVFGAGGDRDRGKRVLMGQAAAAHADVVIVTDDNPRSEEPAAIRAEILRGCPDATEIGDRAEAILRAVDALEAGDALMIAGKGHETGQQVGDVVYPFDDVEQASVAVAALEGRA